MAAGRTDPEIITELYLLAVCREPSATELDASLKQIALRGDRAAGLEDICWAILNTDEIPLSTLSRLSPLTLEPHKS